jgi:NTE family protein
MRSLVLSGGSSKGAYTTGVLRYLLCDLGLQHSSLHGISAGAINAAFLAQFPVGQEKDGANQLCDLWSQLTSGKVYKSWWPFGSAHALWRMSFYDSSPLYRLIHSAISLDKIRAAGKTVTAGVVSLNSGKYTVIDQANDNFIDYVIASSSFPVAFSPIKIDGQLWSDGGTKQISPLSTAIDFGSTEIDLIVTSPEKRIPLWAEHPGILDILKRTIDLSTEKIMSNDIEKVLMYNRLAEAGFTDKKYVKLNIIRPDNNLIEDLLDFSPDKIKTMMNTGYNDARKKYIINKT